MRVLLVEDHLLLRQGLRALFQGALDMEIVGETGQAASALALARRLQPDVVLLDIRLDRSSGLDVARLLRQELPRIKVIVLSAYAHETYVRTLLAIGVDGYLLKTTSETDLIEAVRAVGRGEQVLGPEVVAQLTQPRRSGGTPTARLSEREREVLLLVSAGASNKEIGRQLGLRENTVVAYLRAIMAKLGARSRTEAVTMAVRNGIIVLEEV